MPTPRVSINILTKNRPELLKKALESLELQTFKDYEVIVVSDGSTEQTSEKAIEKEFINNSLPVNFVFNDESIGITLARKKALQMSKGEYVAILDDDDRWLDPDKLKKQVEFLDSHPDYALVGGAIKTSANQIKYRTQSDGQIRWTMLFRNNFFTSTAMFRRQTAIQAGGWVKGNIDLAEDYDLWLRMGKLAKMHNFRDIFALYSQPHYNKEKFSLFLQKQLELISKHKKDYPFYHISSAILRLRLQFFKF